MGPVPTKVREQRLILRHTQIDTDHFHGQDLAVMQDRLRSTLAQSLVAGHQRQRLVNPAEDRDNKIVQVHGLPPRSVTALRRSV
jgi:hypothetical protein